MSWREYVTYGAIGLVFIGIIMALFGAPVDWRIMSLGLLLLGVVLYIIEGPNLLPKQSGWYIAANSLSSAIVICFLGLVFNNALLFVVAGVGLIALWIIILANKAEVLPYTQHQHRH